ncbi:AlpA family phage regulatory protein [Massilia sp. RP-1-19]|uniref:AlpA family phage regulatory protein n=1 Tax=Massilia polaris TaxID=2728846 RepID=A0A848HL06_9BURK|nr:AlpA family phage regulatory protein [Massilia polaris]NML61852.1 AlpA family phage regulatory protein [Massilia polaris]
MSDTQTFAGDLPPTGYVRQTDLVGRPSKGIRGVIPFSATTLWRMVAAGTFPKPIKLSPGCTAWRVEDIREWMAQRG